MCGRQQQINNKEAKINNDDTLIGQHCKEQVQQPDNVHVHSTGLSCVQSRNCFGWTYSRGSQTRGDLFKKTPNIREEIFGWEKN